LTSKTSVHFHDKRKRGDSRVCRGKRLGFGGKGKGVSKKVRLRGKSYTPASQAWKKKTKICEGEKKSGNRTLVFSKNYFVRQPKQPKRGGGGGNIRPNVKRKKSKQKDSRGGRSDPGKRVGPTKHYVTLSIGKSTERRADLGANQNGLPSRMRCIYISNTFTKGKGGDRGGGKTRFKNEWET